VLTIVVVMLGILLVAGLVVTFVAYPHRGRPLPTAPWLGEAMARAAERVTERVPTLATEDREPSRTP
jgi:hypothetical protein